MKRDMDLIRELVLRFESAESVFVGRKFFKIEGRSDDEVSSHLRLLEDAGYVDHPSPWEPFPGGARMEIGMRLTNTGHDFLDSVRDPAIWQNTKAGAKKAGGFSLEIIGALAKGLLKKKIAQHTGVEIDL